MVAKALLAAGALTVLVLLVIGWRFSIFILPPRWTGELARLAEHLKIRPGTAVADIGAGDGTFALAMARLVGPSGIVYATELSPAKRDTIRARAMEAAIPQIRVVEATATDPNLPDDCCEAVYLRAVLHHLPDRTLFARQIRTAVRPAGRLAIVDFPPGGLWFHGGDHGVTAQAAREAFEAAGWSLVSHEPEWGGGLYMLLFEPGPDGAR